MNSLFVLLVGNIIAVFLGVSSDAVPIPGSKFKHGFEKFIELNGYHGGSTGVLLGNRLGFASGVGQTITRHSVSTETVLPASGVSKVLTALTVIKLMEEGLVHPTDRVFGAGGHLEKLTPKNEEITDKRILTITVDDLLRHAGGWDAESSQIGDAVFNEYLVEGNHNLVNITKELKLKTKLHVYDVIRFMATKSLEFDPGTKSSVSNLGYVILGRVIEEATGMPYETVVRDKLLNSCGMWHTRLGPHLREGQTVFKGRTPREIQDELRQQHEVIGEYYAYVQPYLVDACLGWFSNVYDLMRLAQCLDGSMDYRILNHTSVDYISAKPRAWKDDSRNWHGAGFKVHESGAIWVGDETHAPDIVFLHRNLKRHSDGHVYTDDENEPIAWTFMFEGKPTVNVGASLKQLTRVVVESETHWPKTDAYIEDVSDTLLTVGTKTKLMKSKVEEHHANAYLNALKLAQFNVNWINAYTNKKTTYMAILAEKDRKASRECVAVVGLDRHKLVQTKLKLEKEGYNMTFFQNYQSHSHIDKYIFLAIFHIGAFPGNESHILYGLQHFDRPYKTLLQLYEEKGYHPLVQSVEFKRDDALLSFILESDSKNEGDQSSLYYSKPAIRLDNLDNFVQEYALKQMRLIYLDVSMQRSRPKFSAIFKKTNSHTPFLIEIDTPAERLKSTVENKQAEGYLPVFIVGYSLKDNTLKYVVYMEKP